MFKTNMKVSEDYGCIYTVVEGVLFEAPVNADGQPPAEEEWGEVSEPASQKFLDEVNKNFDTEFTMNQFGCIEDDHE